MATLNTTNIKHASSSSNNIVLASNGSVTIPNLTATAFSTSTSLGITHARIYRITSTFSLTSGSTTLTNNWEYADDASAGVLGSGWSLPSSGIFSFPATGIYTVKASALISAVAGTNMPYAGLDLAATINNSSYDPLTTSYSSQEYDDLNNTRYHNVHVTSIIDCTDTSNVKFKVMAYRDVNFGNVSFLGDSGANYTYVEVTRLGDT